MLWILAYVVVGVGIWIARCYAGSIDRYEAPLTLCAFALGWPIVGLCYAVVWLIVRTEDAADWLNAAGVRRSAKRKARS